MENQGDPRTKEAKAFVQNRQRAYLTVFDKKSELVQQVLSDLAKFCRAGETTFHSDPRIHAALEGRREVWLRIEQHLKIGPDDLWHIINRRGA